MNTWCVKSTEQRSRCWVFKHSSLYRTLYVFRYSIVWANTSNRLKLHRDGSSRPNKKQSGWRTQKYKLNEGSRSLIILFTFYLFFSPSFWSLAKRRTTMKSRSNINHLLLHVVIILYFRKGTKKKNTHTHGRAGIRKLYGNLKHIYETEEGEKTHTHFSHLLETGYLFK